MPGKGLGIIVTPLLMLKAFTEGFGEGVNLSFGALLSHRHRDAPVPLRIPTPQRQAAQNVSIEQLPQCQCTVTRTNASANSLKKGRSNVASTPSIFVS